MIDTNAELRNNKTDLVKEREKSRLLELQNAELAEENKRVTELNKHLENSSSTAQLVKQQFFELKKTYQLLARSKPGNHLDALIDAETTRDKLNTFFVQAPAGICVLDGPEFVIELVNPRYQSLYPGRILLGRRAIEALPEYINKQAYTIIQDVYRTGKSYEGHEIPIKVVRNPEYGPELRYFNVIFQARRSKLGAIDGIIIFGFEVTNMVLVRRKLENSERRFRIILDALPQIAWTSTGEGEINFVNQRWYEFTGIDFEKNRNQLWELTVHIDDLQVARSKISGLLKRLKPGEVEFRKRRADGNYRWHLARIKPVFDEQGALLFWIGTATDIQDMKLLQQQKDDFINIASHELKTPLTSLQLAVQVLNERLETLSVEAGKKLLLQAARSIEKVVHLVDDLLNTGQLSHGQMEIQRSWFCPQVLMASYCQELEAGGMFKVCFSGDNALLVYADPKQMERVFINILNNAVKYAGDSPVILFNIVRIDGFIRLSITDHGAGIAPEIIPHLFDRYYYTENKGLQPTGLGLGLYICKEIISIHQGKIYVKSEVGKGSEFVIEIPFHKL